MEYCPLALNSPFVCLQNIVTGSVLFACHLWMWLLIAGGDFLRQQRNPTALRLLPLLPKGETPCSCLARMFFIAHACRLSSALLSTNPLIWRRGVNITRPHLLAQLTTAPAATTAIAMAVLLRILQWPHQEQKKPQQARELMTSSCAPCAELLTIGAR